MPSVRYKSSRRRRSSRRGKTRCFRSTNPLRSALKKRLRWSHGPSSEPQTKPEIAARRRALTLEQTKNDVSPISDTIASGDRFLKKFATRLNNEFVESFKSWCQHNDSHLQELLKKEGITTDTDGISKLLLLFIESTQRPHIKEILFPEIQMLAEHIKRQEVELMEKLNGLQASSSGSYYAVTTDSFRPDRTSDEAGKLGERRL